MTLTTIEVAALIVALEFALLAWTGPILLLRRRSRSAGEESEGAAALLADVENKVPSRREALSTIFASTYQLEGDELEARIEEFVEREQAFYQVMTSVYLERDPERLKEIPEELTKVISPWIRMTPKNMVDASSLDELATANSALNEQLDETRRSMDELMAEYVAAFNKAEKLTAEQAVPVDTDAEADPGAAATAAAESAAGVEPAPNVRAEAQPEAAAAPGSESADNGDVELLAGDKAAVADNTDDDELPHDDTAVALGDFGDEAAGGDAAAVNNANDAMQAEPVAADAAPASATAAPVIDLDADPDEEPAASAARTPAAALSIDLSADPDEELSKDDLDALFADDLGTLEESESASASA